MSLGEKQSRRLDRPAMVDPYFAGGDPSLRVGAPGYSQPSAVDSSGYSVRDPFADQGHVPAYDDPTVRVVPGGALGEAGAGWEPVDASNLYPQGEYIGPNFVNHRAPIDGQGVTMGHAFAGLETGLGRVPAADSPLEYQGKDAPRRNLGDGEVYDDLYGSGREFGSRRGREDDGLGRNDPADGGGDAAGRRMMSGRRLSDRSDDAGYS